ncbi:hypothetical protein COO60DRAFT_627575 [Scenedesmus sp. NREL 46B-D3]|nr:hypothetical protein COO60DRAFT_627575 [Scenedesmus sp. NREL 46B-D3]
MLQPLAAAQLTRVAVEVPDRNFPTMTAVAALTLLRSLDLTFSPGAPLVRYRMAQAELLAAQNSALQPLAAGLQQLTELRIGPVFARQLQHLPLNLQQLHLTVSVDCDPQQLLRLASWAEQCGSLISSLELVDFSHVYDFNPIPGPDWDPAVDALGEAFAAAAHAAAQTAAASAECSTHPAVNKGLQLQSLTLGSDGCAATLGLLQHLPAHSLAHLELRLGPNAALELPCLAVPVDSAPQAQHR